MLARYLVFGTLRKLQQLIRNIESPHFQLEQCACVCLAQWCLQWRHEKKKIPKKKKTVFFFFFFFFFFFLVWVFFCFVFFFFFFFFFWLRKFLGFFFFFQIESCFYCTSQFGESHHRLERLNLDHFLTLDSMTSSRPRQKEASARMPRLL
jgi:chromate transport protein ChrA